MTIEPFTVVVDGVEMPARPGDTVGAVLTRAGRSSWRRTRHGNRPRGLFCGIGACHDCLLTVDDVRGVRACLAPAVPGMRVTTGDRDADA